LCSLSEMSYVYDLEESELFGIPNQILWTPGQRSLKPIKLGRMGSLAVECLISGIGADHPVACLMRPVGIVRLVTNFHLILSLKISGVLPLSRFKHFSGVIQSDSLYLCLFYATYVSKFEVFFFSFNS